MGHICPIYIRGVLACDRQIYKKALITTQKDLFFTLWGLFVTIWGYWGIFLSFGVKRAVLRYIGLNFRRIQGSPHRDYIPQAGCGCHTMLRIDYIHAPRRDEIQHFVLMIYSPNGLMIYTPSVWWYTRLAPWWYTEHPKRHLKESLLQWEKGDRESGGWGVI